MSELEAAGSQPKWEITDFGRMKRALLALKAPNSMASFGEMIAASIHSKRKDEVIERLQTIDDKALTKMAECLMSSIETLDARRQMVIDALDRLEYAEDCRLGNEPSKNLNTDRTQNADGLPTIRPSP
jgi:hypothetical protein